MYHLFIKIFVWILLGWFLAACGGGGGSGDKSLSSSATVSSISSNSSLIANSSADTSSSLASMSSVSSISNASSSSVSLIKDLIKLNQLGYKPASQKLAVIPNVPATNFSVLNSNSQLVLTADLTAAKTWSASNEVVKLADFSQLTTEGEYILKVDGLEKTANFKIAANTYSAVNAASIKAFYYNRASTELLETHAGIYKRAAGHLGTTVYVHKSAETNSRPEGTVISTPKGWYDAGDYNLYIVNSGITTYTLLAAYEAFPDYFNSQNLNIPESNNAAADLLDEIMWNLEWMLSMQDTDGGVYHKLTSKNFSGFVMPAADTSARYVVQKNTAATLDFAAVMAVASRVYAEHEEVFPGRSAQMLTAAKNAWAWAKANPAIYYSQPSDISTGGYGDNNVSDEFFWAATELYITTKEDAYYTEMNPSTVTADIPWWGGVKSLGWISLARHIDSLTQAADENVIRTRLNGVASGLVTKKTSSAYGVSMQASDFYWGSNSGALNQAMMLLAAYDLDQTKKDYLNAAQSLLDYVLGRNATDYSFVTGYGVKTPQNIHHRPSGADAIAAPIPGFIAGGPNPGQEDKSGCSKPYPSNLPAKSYLDEECSYASNEIAINWNAPLVYVSAGVQVRTE